MMMNLTISATAKKVKKQDDDQHDFSQHMLNTKNTFDTLSLAQEIVLPMPLLLLLLKHQLKPIILYLFTEALALEKLT